jgi:aminocarboxymuconate-semialdehyde decarboxylase
MNVIDVHCHVVPSGFPPAPPSCQRWPAMNHRANDQAMVMIGKREFRLVDSRCWDTARRIADMNEEAVGIQAISPMPELLSYGIEASDNLVLSRSVNRAIAEMVHAAPSRFVGMGMVPLHDPELAAKELASLRADCDLIGVEIGSNIAGKSPGDPFFDPFYREAERLGLAVFVHALHPSLEGRLVGPPLLGAYVGNPTESGIAAASVITGRVLEKFPRLRIGFSHGGGTLASFLPRLETGWQRVAALKEAFASPAATARRMYYDNIVYQSPLLKYLIDTFGVTQIFVGSDYPFTAGQKNSAKMFDGLGLSPDDLAALRGGNAARFLNLDGRTQ